MSDVDSPFSDIPEDIVKSVLERSGFTDTAEAISEPQADPPAAQDEGPSVEAEDEYVALPTAPGGPLFKDEDSEETPTPEPPDPNIITLPDGRKYPLALVQEWADRQSQAHTIAAPTEPPATPTPTFTLPTISEEDLEAAGPVGRALLMIASEQAKRQQQLETQLKETREAADSRAERENAEIANAAASSFQTTYNLPEPLMEQIKKTASVYDIQEYLQRDLNPYKAVEYALTKSFWNLPEARQYEFQRQEEARNQAILRKKKLAGISGASGSGPRGTPPPDTETPQGRYEAAVELARQAMYGDQQ